MIRDRSPAQQRRCKTRGCGKWFFPTRSDQIYCSKPACRVRAFVDKHGKRPSPSVRAPLASLPPLPPLPPRRCKTRGCGKFTPKRADQLYCNKPACRQRALWAKNHRDYHRDPLRRRAPPLPPRLCAGRKCQSAIDAAGNRVAATIYPKRTNEIYCASCRAVPKSKRRTRR